MLSHRLSHSFMCSPDGAVGGGLSPSIRPLGQSSIGQPGSIGQPARAAAELPPDPPKPKIQAFAQSLGAKRHEDNWTRTPNVTGTGAIHVKSFHSKLSDDALVFIDQQVNEWLDSHPQYEVKFVTTGIGEFVGKVGKEPHLVMQVWV